MGDAGLYTDHVITQILIIVGLFLRSTHFSCGLDEKAEFCSSSICVKTISSFLQCPKRVLIDA